MKKLITLSLLLGLSAPVTAKVWQTTTQWNQEYENLYSKWIESPEVHKDMFVSKSSPYYGGRYDCADAAYALRAIFASKHGLPFALKNPTGSRGRYAMFSNEVNKFDKYPAGPKRVTAFLNYISDMVGTENLSRHDTYPIKIDSVTSGKLYTYKIRARFGSTIRHAYTIKEVNQTGTFDLIYATQAIRKKNLPLNYRKEKPLVNLPHDVWGFRAFKWPRLLGTSPSEFPAELNYSTEQYAMAKQMGRGFFKHVKNTLKTVDEDDSALLTRVFNNVCTEAQARIEYVNQGYQHHVSTGRKCMNYADYDAYSTPARDKALKDAYETLWSTYLDLHRAGELYDAKVYEHVNALFWHESTTQDRLYEPTRDQKEALLFACPIQYKEGTTIDLATLFTRLRRGKLSSHPNDSLEVRWGEVTGPKTRCKQWY